MRLIKIWVWAVFSTVCGSDVAAQHSKTPLDLCLDYTQTLDAQVLSCEAALLADGVTSEQLSYLPVIIAILGAGNSDIIVDRSAIEGRVPHDVALLIAMGGGQIDAERCDLARAFHHAAIFSGTELIEARDRFSQLIRDIDKRKMNSPMYALRFANCGLAADPNDFELYELRAMAFSLLDDWGAAEADWEAVMLYSDRPHISEFIRAVFLSDIRRYEDALNIVESLIEKSDQSGDYALLGSVIYFKKLYSLCSFINLRVERFDAAFSCTTNGLPYDLNSVYLLAFRAESLWRLGDFSEAERLFSVALDITSELNRPSSEVRFVLRNRAAFYLDQGEISLALRDLGQLLAQHLDDDR